MSFADLLLWATILAPTLLATYFVVGLLRTRFRLRREVAQLRQVRMERDIARRRARDLQTREAIATRLHDDLGHRLTRLTVSAAALEATTEADVGAQIGRMRQQLAGTVETLNESIAHLYDDTDDTIDAVAGVDSAVPQRSEHVDVRGMINEHVQTIAALGRHVECDRPPRDAWSTAGGRALLDHTLAEGLTNAVKHGADGVIILTVKREGAGLSVEIRNRARAGVVPQPSGGHGLALLERDLVGSGGSLTTNSRTDDDSSFWILKSRIPAAIKDSSEESPDVADLGTQLRRYRRALIWIPAVVFLVLAMIPVGGYVAQAALSHLDASEFGEVRPGQAQSQAETHLPVMQMESPPPAGAHGDCRHYESTFSPFDRTDVYEVCFVNGTVSSTDTIPGP